MAKAEITVHVADLPAVKEAMAEANRYVTELRAERDRLRETVARVEALADEFSAESIGAQARADAMARTDDNVRHHTAERRHARVAAHHAAALSGAISALGSTDSDPALTERQAATEGAGDGV